MFALTSFAHAQGTPTTVIEKPVPGTKVTFQTEAGQALELSLVYNRGIFGMTDRRAIVHTKDGHVIARSRAFSHLVIHCDTPNPNAESCSVYAPETRQEFRFDPISSPFEEKTNAKWLYPPTGGFIGTTVSFNQAMSFQAKDIASNPLSFLLEVLVICVWAAILLALCYRSFVDLKAKRWVRFTILIAVLAAAIWLSLNLLFLWAIFVFLSPDRTVITLVCAVLLALGTFAVIRRKIRKSQNAPL